MLLDLKRKALGHFPCVAAAVGVAAAASVASAAVSSSGAQSAANTQADAQQNASAQQMSMFNTINGQEQPFIQSGYGATTALNQLLGLAPGNAGSMQNGYLAQTTPFSFDPSSITSSPGYQFAQKQGLNQVMSADAPGVGALSGAALKDLTNFSTGTAEQYYNNYFNQALSSYGANQTQQNNIFSRLSGIAGLGQNAASNVGTAGTQLGTGAAQATAAAGAAQAAGTVGSTNAISGGISSAGNSLLLNQVLSGGGGGAGNGYSAPIGIQGWTPASAGS